MPNYWASDSLGLIEITDSKAFIFGLRSILHVGPTDVEFRQVVIMTPATLECCSKRLKPPSS